MFCITLIARECTRWQNHDHRILVPFINGNPGNLRGYFCARSMQHENLSRDRHVRCTFLLLCGTRHAHANNLDVSSVSRAALGRRACLAGHGLERLCWCSLKADSTSRNAHGRLGCEQCVKRFSWPSYLPGMVQAGKNVLVPVACIASVCRRGQKILQTANKVMRSKITARERRSFAKMPDSIRTWNGKNKRACKNRKKDVTGPQGVPCRLPTGLCRKKLRDRRSFLRTEARKASRLRIEEEQKESRPGKRIYQGIKECTAERGCEAEIRKGGKKAKGRKGSFGLEKKRDKQYAR